MNKICLNQTTSGLLLGFFCANECQDDLSTFKGILECISYTFTHKIHQKMPRSCANSWKSCILTNLRKEHCIASSTVRLTPDHCLVLHDVATFCVFALRPLKCKKGISPIIKPLFLLRA